MGTKLTLGHHTERQTIKRVIFLVPAEEVKTDLKNI